MIIICTIGTGVLYARVINNIIIIIITIH